MGKFLITFLLFVLIIVFIKASKSKPKSGETNENKSVSSKSRSFSDGKGNRNESASSESKNFSKKKGKGNGRCNDHDQCPDDYACLLAEGKKVKKCVQCNCSETSQCYLERETTFCNCSGTGFTGQYCETCELLPQCPMGWYQNRNSCYIYDCTARDWLSAVSHCQSLSPNGYPNSYLIEITDEEESQVAFAISSITGVSNAWIGLSDTETEGIFKWINSGNSLTYQPEDYVIFDAYYDFFDYYYNYFYNYNYVEVLDCVHLHYEHWDAEKCSEYKSVVCEMPALIQ